MAAAVLESLYVPDASPLEVLADELAGIARDVEADVRRQVEVIVARGAQQLAEMEARFMERRFALLEFETDAKRRLEHMEAHSRAWVDEVRESVRDGVDGKDGRDADPAQFEALAASLEAKVAERLATIRDGKDGENADPAQFEILATALEARVDERLATVRDGKDADPAQFETLAASLEARVDERLATVRDGKDADPAQFDALAQSLTDKVEARLSELRDGKDGQDIDPVRFNDLASNLNGLVRDRLIEIRDELLSDPTLKGDPGSPGKLPMVRDWTRGVHYEGDVVTCGGSLWQASRDTGEAPGHEDWTLLAAAGRDAREVEHRGAYDANNIYSRLEIVALDGGAFMALRDDPGPCPGDGWRLLVARGKPGKPGDPGPKSTEPGPPGKPGVGIADVAVEGFALIVSLTNGDTIARDMRPMFEEYHAQVRA
jgi:hypothetical protein